MFLFLRSINKNCAANVICSYKEGVVYAIFFLYFCGLIENDARDFGKEADLY